MVIASGPEWAAARMRCLNRLGEWDRLAELCGEVFRSNGYMEEHHEPVADSSDHINTSVASGNGDGNANGNGNVGGNAYGITNGNGNLNGSGDGNGNRSDDVG